MAVRNGSMALKAVSIAATGDGEHSFGNRACLPNISISSSAVPGCVEHPKTPGGGFVFFLIQ
eukprot:3983237-Karenia_brevis.AAC.1